MADTVFGMRILPQLDQAGLTKVSAQLQKMSAKAGSIKLDAKSAKAFNDMSKGAAKHFNDLIGKAQLTGLHSAVGDLTKARNALEREMVSGMKALATLQTGMQKAQESGRQAEAEAMAKQMRVVEQQLQDRVKMIQQETDAQEKIIQRRSEALEKLEKTSATDFAHAFGEGFTDFLGKVKSKDMEGLAKGLIGGMGKAGGMLEAVGGKMAAGAATGSATASAGGGAAAIGSSIAAAAVPLAAIATTLAAIVALFIAADEQAKEMNRTLLEGAGTADMALNKATGQVDDLTGSLQAARAAAIDMSYEFRESPEDILKIVSAANQAGLTFEEMEKKITKTGNKMEAYSDITRVALTYSRTLGQSTGEIAEQSARFVHDLGGGLQTVENGFSSIYGAAQESGIGVKRFYGFVTQATAGMAMYNVRISEAAALIAELGEALGEAEAAEFVNGLQKGFAAEGYTERFKRVIIAGQSDVAQIMGNSAEATAKEFTKRMAGSNMTDAVGQAFKDAKVEGIDLQMLAEGDMGQISKLAGMSEKQIRQVTTNVRGQDAAMARQLETMIRLSKGVEGGMGEQAKALDELDMGGKLAMMLQTLGDTPLSEMSAMSLAAFEQYSGISGEQLKALRRVDGQLRGNFEELQRQSQLSEDQRMSQEDQIKQFGAFINENGKIVTGAIGDASSQSEIGSVGDYLQSQGETLAATQQSMTEQEVQAKQMVTNTQSIFSFLDTIVKDGLNQIAYWLEELYRVMGPGAMDGNQRAIVDGLKAQAATVADAIMAADQKKAAAERELATSGGDQEKIKAAQQKISAAETEKAVLEERATKLEADARRIAGMETGNAAGALVGTGIRNGTLGLSDYLGITGGSFASEGLRGMASGKSGGSSLGLDYAMTDPMEDAYAAALTETMGPEVAAPIIEKLSKMTDEQKDEAKKLLEETPDLTAEGMLKAMKRREAEKLVTGLGLGGQENSEDLIRKIAAGQKPGEVQKALSSYEGGLGGLGDIAQGLGFGVPGPTGQDFIWRAGQGMQHISSADTVVGSKEGGAMGRGSGGSDQFTINMTFNGAAKSDDVKKAVIQGIRATRQARVGKGAR